MEGFADFYLALRKHYNFKECKTEDDRRRICDELIQYGRFMQETDQIDFPVHTGSLVGKLQYMLARATLACGYNRKSGDLLEEFFDVALVLKENIGWLWVDPNRFSTSAIDYFIREFNDPRLSDKEILEKLQDMLFIESIRQQICTGVGLRCPFWQGTCCNSPFYKKQLECIYQKTKPWKPVWKRYWQPPACLEIQPQNSALSYRPHKGINFNDERGMASYISTSENDKPVNNRKNRIIIIGPEGILGLSPHVLYRYKNQSKLILNYGPDGGFSFK